MAGLFNFRRRHEPGEIQPEILPATSGAYGVEEDNIQAATGSDALNTLKQFKNLHQFDPNLPIEELNDIDDALQSGNAEKGLQMEQVIVEDNSPYAEVRASVRNYDVDLPANTIRAWVIGMVLCTVGSGVNMLFSLRNPSVTVTTYVIQLVAYPIGLLWDVVFPDRVWSLCGLKFNLKPGPFNFKEHVIIVVMSNAAYGGGALYATDVIIAQEKWYHQYFGWGWQILFGITTLCTGYGIAGLSRRFLVWPAAMIWPSDLVNAALFYTLHDHSPSDPAHTNGWRVGRYRWFMIVFVLAFVWYWFPGWIFQGLSWFCWLTWIWPKSKVVNQVFGGLSGYGLMPMTLDWTIVSGYLGSPLIPPFHAIANSLFGIILFFVVVSSGLHFSNVWDSGYLPVQSSSAFANTGHKYNVTEILTDLKFDEAKYKAYSPLFLSTQFALTYGLSFAAVASVVVHVVLYHGQEIWSQFRLARHQEDDVHMRLMKKYRDAEDWWYAVLFVIMIGLSFAVVCGWPTDFPWWGYIVCMILPLVWTIPIGIIQAITNIQLGLNVLTEFIVGYMLPGRPLAMMMFKNYGYLCMSQALYFAQDLKLGHYMKVPPRTMFWAQLAASIWSAIVQIAVMNWALGSIHDVCSDDQKNSYTCANAKVFYTASVIWGAIGPKRMFSGDAIYHKLQYFWLVGAITPIITWFLARRYPKSVWRYVNMPLIFGGPGWLPPATVFIYLCWGSVGTFFNWFVKRRWSGWWMQYNYVTSAGLDSGLIVSTLIIFFSLYLTSATAPQWFGNVGALETLDMKGKALHLELPAGQKFGPSNWS
ncbi:small oligopeptide transporter [Grosmannia clavigera kw1407]|uniref:Small oligopeptide transporter n=1 Tax=Grosmannia clavigera (strain kw1407 / UAMH 11150) TaxID=655863 RepID=F0XT95_GROCL|nr:small oligopeptide transporter [Grosmannia clavigera kw1407]EFW99104.1 small oligopeptide transporter [Grosmannia clavigera kw1407]